MPDASKRLRLLFLVGAGALFTAGGFLFLSAPDQASVAPAGAELALRPVDLYRVSAGELRARVEVSGVLEGRRDATLFSETRGPVLELGAEELDAVSAGQVLLRIDPLQAEVAVERARAVVARRESELALARSNLARRRGLAEQGVASDADLDDALNGEKVAAAALRQGRAELREALDALENKTIVAPFSGFLRRFAVEKGEFVRDGQDLGELVDLSAVRTVIGLSDRQVVAVHPDQPVVVRVSARPGERFRGSVLRVGAASDPETRKFPVEVLLPNPEGRLLPGMAVTVVLELGEAGPRIVIPAEAVVDEFGLSVVWVVAEEEGGLVARRRRVGIRSLPFEPGRVEVVAGLRAGEEIAVSSTRQLQDGEAVRRGGRNDR
ncbi:MAG: efflux RND transporter periplasmic adaptor subunit [Myxococcota bacterium]|nr:efflux RND transporter periplasmic adaptor subunit [Myxococcota bacterium]